MQFDEILNELEEQKELATNRMAELEKLSGEHQEALTDVEKLKIDVSIMLIYNIYRSGKIEDSFIYRSECWIYLVQKPSEKKIKKSVSILSFLQPKRFRIS